MGKNEALEEQEFDFQSRHSSNCSRLQEEIDELDRMLHSGVDDEGSLKSDHYYQGSNERLESAKKKKLRQTRKHYDTYNALLEIKELMLKETSLLNSISLQFQNAITSADGRTKLINSLEGILNGTQQKLEKVQLTLQSEQKLCDTVKDKHAAAISEQRQSSSLLKLFQEECARNERLQAQVHGKTPCT
ncbi:UNVERIFIED_CONTAM: Coiled-coil domain-containing protein 93 [Sesamum calycinum]|uniref:Coiled-coil domain-containing protein 93 n=1 Tax=Sesamum calycinum TaxID=2727403 RepID=A0AAW2LXJ5_9LAMI